MIERSRRSVNYGDSALNSHGPHGSTVSITNANCVASHASKILRSDCDKTTRRANHPNSVQPFSKKYSACRVGQISGLSPRVSPT